MRCVFTYWLIYVKITYYIILSRMKSFIYSLMKNLLCVNPVIILKSIFTSLNSIFLYLITVLYSAACDFFCLICSFFLEIILPW